MRLRRPRSSFGTDYPLCSNFNPQADTMHGVRPHTQPIPRRPARRSGKNLDDSMGAARAPSPKDDYRKWSDLLAQWTNYTVSKPACGQKSLYGGRALFRRAKASFRRTLRWIQARNTPPARCGETNPSCLHAPAESCKGRAPLRAAEKDKQACPDTFARVY